MKRGRTPKAFWIPTMATWTARSKTPATRTRTIGSGVMKSRRNTSNWWFKRFRKSRMNVKLNIALKTNPAKMTSLLGQITSPRSTLATGFCVWTNAMNCIPRSRNGWKRISIIPTCGRLVNAGMSCASRLTSWTLGGKRRSAKRRGII